ncbi:MAG: MBL fold metallo-hydrolase [Saprospiraceae bacterium]|nr:MBL fold metallo-hydrolase [Saprospiraceae bacterium]
MKHSDDHIALTFLGGAGTVTGSKILISYRDQNLLVDCGLFQGLKKLRLLNWKQLAIDPKSIGAVILTHAHLDHIGYLPILVRDGYKNEMHSTHPTRALAKIILEDSGKIQEEESERANRHKYTRHAPANPLYTVAEATQSINYFVTHSYLEWVIVNNDMKFRFLNAGHIIGSAIVELIVGNRRFIFSGDLGRSQPLLMHPPDTITETDVLILESTYGDRLHPGIDPKEELKEVIWSTYNKKGILMIPTFAVERAQELLFLISLLKEENNFPGMPVFLDSPMGVDATETLFEYSDWQKLNLTARRSLNSAAQLISNARASRAIVADDKPKIVLAGSGMLSGGRILHYLDRHLGSKKNTILLAGFQAAGTRGRALVEGVSEIKFFGSYHQVKAEVRQMHSLSSHADQSEILAWARHFDQSPAFVFLNHGEPHQADGLRVKLRHELGWNPKIASMGVTYRIPV